MWNIINVSKYERDKNMKKNLHSKDHNSPHLTNAPKYISEALAIGIIYATIEGILIEKNIILGLVFAILFLQCLVYY